MLSLARSGCAMPVRTLFARSCKDRRAHVKIKRKRHGNITIMIQIDTPRHRDIHIHVAVKISMQTSNNKHMDTQEGSDN